MLVCKIEVTNVINMQWFINAEVIFITNMIIIDHNWIIFLIFKILLRFKLQYRPMSYNHFIRRILKFHLCLIVNSKHEYLIYSTTRQYLSSLNFCKNYSNHICPLFRIKVHIHIILTMHFRCVNYKFMLSHFIKSLLFLY